MLEDGPFQTIPGGIPPTPGMQPMPGLQPAPQAGVPPLAPTPINPSPGRLIPEAQAQPVPAGPAARLR